MLSFGSGIRQRGVSVDPPLSDIRADEEWSLSPNGPEERFRAGSKV